MLRRILILAFAFLSFPGASRTLAQPGDFSMADAIMTLRVRKALEADESLAPLQLGLRVRGSVVTLWGPVPSLELSNRAMKCLRSLAFVSDVRNHLVVTPDDYLPPAAPPALTPAAVPAPPVPAMEPKSPRPDRITPVEASLPSIVVPIPQQSLRTPIRDE